MTPIESISDSLASAEWDALAHALKKVNIGIQGNDAGAKKLRAELGIVRMIMYEEIREWNGNNTIDLAFFVASFKTIRKLEKQFEKRGIKKNEFMLFLRLLFYKFKKQKIVAVKPLEKMGEFKKMKGVVEHGYGLI
ncbi:Uncharacterised protein [Candidatus Bilamarchaeum dharawalense]|uniref:Uncharacterized protein n=1 Tax=Candidatus Bilamarchaeum dharawalense TaxID=2885759 RepID=A0A5E4LW44_9ARCH|nr:Uncharacterised protein [Candidatus Bilamarchaeum dharawalense]